MKNRYAFTLAEIMAVLVLLGVVMVITVPSALSNALTKSRRLKIKRAVSVYQQVVESMVIENDLPRSEAYIDRITKENNCKFIREYFKISDTVNTGCKFKSVNNIWWDFQNGLTHGIVSFDEKDLNESVAESDVYNAFIFVTNFAPDGGIRVNDIGYEKDSNNGDYWHVMKQDCFMNSKKCKASDYSEEVQD